MTGVQTCALPICVRVVRERNRKNLDRYLAIELRISCLPHLPHAVFAEQGEYLVVTNLVAQRQRYMSMNMSTAVDQKMPSPG